MSVTNPGRIAIVGTGSRGLMFISGISERPNSVVVALCEPNAVRAEYYNQILEEQGRPRVPIFKPEEFKDMLVIAEVDTVVISSIDSTHHIYIIAALEAGVRVVTEKPMTTNVDNCRAINQACKKTGKHINVTFNYRYIPIHELVKRTIAEDQIGNVLSLHFEWLLDTVRGADFFKRWHAYKENSGGLLVHKSGHHFDLVNWWLDAIPSEVAGMGRLAFYGDKNGRRYGYAQDYERAQGNEQAHRDPFAFHIEHDERCSRLYGSDAHKVDGYERDRNCFQPGIDIEDDVGLLVRYDSGAIMTYHITAYSPWQGYRVMFNGTKGRLELEVVDSTHRLKPDEFTSTNSVNDTPLAPHFGSSRVSLHPLWEPSRDLPVVVQRGLHTERYAKMLSNLFGPRPGETVEIKDISNQAATEIDGTMALAVGLAADQSLVTGKFVKVMDLALEE